MISSLLLPLPFSIIISSIGLYLVWFTRQRRLGNIFLTLGFIVLLTFSLSFLPKSLLQNLESRYKPLLHAPTTVHTIVVLGGGVSGNVHYPANTRINSASLSRLVEAIRLYRQLERKGINVKLVLSGGRVFQTASVALKMKNTAVVLGIKPSHIELENGSKDTYHEALYLKPQLKNKPFILVTSAAHMPRAMSIFIKMGMNPIPAPTQYLAKSTANPFKRYFPSSTSLIFSDIALHEYFGIAWMLFASANDNNDSHVSKISKSIYERR